MADWGIFPDDGGAALPIDSIKSIEPDREGRVPTYPIENGDFQSYNKVQMPGEIAVVVTRGGDVASRSELLVLLKAAVGSTDLYHVVVPEGVYSSYSITRVRLKRTADSGVSLLTVEVTFTEVRQTATQATTNSQQPSGAATTANGPTLPGPASPSDTPTISGAPADTPLPLSQPADPASLVGQVPPLAPGASLAQISSTVGQLVKRGATIGNMIAKGVKFANIPLAGKAAQSLSVLLGVQPTQIKVAQKALGLFVDVSVKNAPLSMGTIARDAGALVRAASPAAFQGDLMFYDTTGKGADPTLAGLGTRFLLLHAGAS